MGYKGELPATHRGTVDVHLDRGPGVVYWVNMVVTTGDGTLRLHDGPSTTGDTLVTIKQDAGQPGLTPFNPPLPYEKGLFVDCVDHIQDFTICYDHLEEPE